MLRTRWIVLCTAVVLIAASFLAERRPGGGRSAPGGELVWATGAIGATPGGSAQDIVAAWNQLHPNGPRVRIEVLPNSPDDQRQQMALELEAKSSELDILTLDLIWTGEFAENGWLADLEEIRPSIERVSLPGPVQSAMWKGKLWAAPQTTDAAFLYYRTDLVDHPPATWDELMEVGLRVGREHGIAPFVGQGARYEGMVVSFLEYLWGAGTDLFDPEGTKVVFEEAPALRAVELMRTALREGFFAPGFNTMKEEDARDAFQSGNAVFMRNWPYAYDLMTGRNPRNPSQVAGRYGIAPLPALSGQRPISGLGGHNLGVNRFSDNVEGAKAFALFVSTTPDVQRMLARDHSMAPTLESAYEDLTDDPVMTLLRKVLPDARPRPSTPIWNEISQKIQEEIYAAYNDDRDPRAAVGSLRRFLESTLARH